MGSEPADPAVQDTSVYPTKRDVEEIFLRRCQWRGRSQNLVHKLAQRQVLVRCPAQAYHRNRSLYHCIVPNHTEQSVWTPPGFLRKFSPDGQVLLAFSSDQREVVVYKYRGASSGQPLYGEANEEPNASLLLFNSFFKERVSIVVAQNGEHLNRECSLFSSDCQHVLVVASDMIREDFPNMFDIFHNNESISITSLTVLEDYTLYLVDIVRGVVADSVAFKCDKINLSHNQGLSLCDSRLAVLSLQQQTIHLFDISNGELVPVQDIGRFCYPHGRVSVDYHDLTVSESESLFPTNSITEKWFTTLKHRLICFLLRQAEGSSTPTDRSPLLKFYDKYPVFKALRIIKMQLLDRSHLVMKYASEEVITKKQSDSSQQCSLYVFYNIETTEILSVNESTSDSFLSIYERHVDCFRYPVSHPLCRTTSSLSNNAHSRALHNKFKETIRCAKYGGSLEATRRLLAHLPVSSQSFSASPYLDVALFHYDDKWISSLERPKPCGDNPVK